MLLRRCYCLVCVQRQLLVQQQGKKRENDVLYPGRPPKKSVGVLTSPHSLTIHIYIHSETLPWFLAMTYMMWSSSLFVFPLGHQNQRHKNTKPYTHETIHTHIYIHTHTYMHTYTHTAPPPPPPPPPKFFLGIECQTCE